MKKILIILACMALFPCVASAAQSAADINGDGVVDAFDQTELMAAMQADDGFGRSASTADLNKDGAVDMQDLRIFREAVLSGDAQ